MDPIKDAFDKVKSDMDSLNDELKEIAKGVVETRNHMSEICIVIQKLFEKVENIAKKQEKLEKTAGFTIKSPISQNSPTYLNQNSTTPTHNPTLPHEIGGLKPQNLGISTGNGGVPTDRQTDRQIDNPTHFIEEKVGFLPPTSYFNSPINPSQHIPPSSQIPQNLPPITSLPISVNNASEILASLDSIKKEVRLKVKRLTEQEWLIFSTIYQLEEQLVQIDYKTLSKRLKLTESSIRDYVGRIIKKGLPVDKTKLNNKTIQLSISPNLKKIASLSTIMQLRGI